jgi:DNA-directed RNA polymerase specialized sigma24 family protein
VRSLRHLTRTPQRGTTLGRVEPTEDERLLARLMAGDERALSEAYGRFAPMVYGLCRRMTNDNAAAEDLCHEIFVDLWRNPTRYRGDHARLQTALAVSAHQRAVRWRRGAHPSSIVEPPGAQGAVAALPEEQQQAFNLAYYGARTYREVAAALSISDGAAKANLRMALTQLVNQLRADGMSAWT